MNRQMIMNINIAVAVVAEGAFLPQAIKPQTPNAFTRQGLPIPGAYFKNKKSPQPATVAVSKSAKIVRQQKQPMSKAGNKQTKRGTAWISQHPLSNPFVPAGAYEDSGLRVEFGEKGVEDFSNLLVT